nr:MAG: ORF1 [Torque teno midi virus]
MPFWWRRRRKPWYGRWKTKRFNKYKKRKTRRRLPRRRYRRPTRRRRRRRNKVRRKKATIPVRQWQPDSIRKCKIRGLGVLIIGEEGKQMDCYTVNKHDYVQPKVPYGGGFGVEEYSLQYLYEEYKMHNNIWTSSNLLKDLVRFLRCRFTFFRHPDTDFVIRYQRQLPFTLTKFTYPAVHPHQLLLTKHHLVLLSKASKPNGKYKKKITVKPPKQMLSKWFFTKPFSEYPLVLLQAAACNMRYSQLSATSPNLLVSLLSLNPSFYQNSNWAATHTQPYLPYNNATQQLKYKVIINKQEVERDMKEAFQSYGNSVSYEYGWFNPTFMQATEILAYGTHLATHQVIAGRYNPTTDDGVGNQVYIISTLAEGWGPPRTDKTVILEGIPLWLGLFGFVSYLKTIKHADVLKTSLVVIKSTSIHCLPEIGACQEYIPIDYIYITGKKPYQQTISTYEKRYWYPNIQWQLQTLNAIVESGPFIPQYSEERNSSWELKYTYEFFFKWGGPNVPDPEVKDPGDMQTYPVPDTVGNPIQIFNPAKQAPETIFHPWDYRRGIIKERAIKRMSEHLETDTDFEPITEPQKKKKRKGAALQNPQEKVQEIQECLHSLCEEPTWQDPPQNIQQLLQYQREQQQHLKYNILKLLMEMKEKQRMLQLQTGLLD